MKFKFFAFISAIAVLATSFPQAQAASVTKKPLVGNCYNYTAADVSGDGSKKGPVKCTSTHTAETYRVGTWREAKGPFELELNETWAVANKLCQPFKGQSRFFNYWAYYLPTQAQWNAGQRWIRCDAMISADEKATSFVSWKGKRLDIK